MSYLSVVLLYPSILTSTAGGVCVLLSKSATIIAPFIAEMQPPFQVVTILCVAVLATFISACLKVPQDSTVQRNDIEEENAFANSLKREQDQAKHERND